MNRVKVSFFFANKVDFHNYAFKYFILSLNKFQNTYEFNFQNEKIVLKEEKSNPTKWVTCLKDKTTDLKLVSDYNVVFVSNRLDNDYFAYPDEDVAVITSFNWEKKYSPPSLFEYLVTSIYYCLIYSQKKVNVKILKEKVLSSTFDVHSDTFGCYADAANDRKDNRIGVAMGYICDKHKESISSYYGVEYLNETLKILERKWIGNLEEKNSIAYNLKHYFNFNIFKDSGFNKNLWEYTISKLYDIPGSLFGEGLKLILTAAITALLIKLGLSIKK